MKNKNNVKPPKYIQHFLRWFCQPDLLPSIEGDLIELFQERTKEKGVQKAKWLFAWEVLKLFRPALIKSSQRMNIIFPALLRSTFRSTWRRMKREKVYTSTNLIGLSIGFIVFFITVLYTDYERGFDKFLPEYGDIYRFEEHWNRSGDIEHWTAIKSRLVSAIYDKYPDITTARVFKPNIADLTYEDKIINSELIFYVDSTFNDVFQYEIIAGADDHLFSNPDQVLLTETMAKRFFDEEVAIGKVIEFNQSHFVISGVIKDPPKNSHFHVDALFPLIPLWKRMSEFNLDDNTFYSYVRVPTDRTSFLGKSINHELSSIKWYENDLSITGNTCSISLNPIQSIHLYGDGERELEKNGSAMIVNIIEMIGWFILIMSCVNYINLATSRSLNRGAEVGIRKLHGSSKLMISVQFLLESVLFCLVSIIVSVIIVWALLPNFNQYFNFDIHITAEYAWQIVSRIGLVTLAFGLLSGIYPAIQMSNIGSVRTLRLTGASKGHGGTSVRRGFIAFQLMVSVFTIMSVIVISFQLDFIQNKNLGLNAKNVMVIPVNGGEYNTEIGRLKEALKNESEVKSASASFTYPGSRFPFLTYRFPNLNKSGAVNPTQEDGSIWMRSIFGDQDIVETFGLELIEGRTLSQEIAEGVPVEFIINESAVKFLGLENAIGETVEFTNNAGDREINKGKIVGVVKDFNYASLHNAIEPMIIFPTKWGRTKQYLSVAFESSPNDIAAKVEHYWQEYLGNVPFNYYFLDDQYRDLYKSENHLQTFISILAVISVVISIIGLLGMSFYAMEQKKYEIGIRKVLGANVLSILKMNTKEYAIMALLANVIMLPLTYLICQNWLNDFAYSVPIGFGVIATTAGFVFLLVVGAVSYNVLSSALKNPVDIIFRG